MLLLLLLLSLYFKDYVIERPLPSMSYAFLKLLQHSLAAISGGIKSFSSSVVCSLYLMTWVFKYPQRKETQEDRSGEQDRFQDQMILFTIACHNGNWNGMAVATAAAQRSLSHSLIISSIWAVAISNPGDHCERLCLIIFYCFIM